MAEPDAARSPGSPVARVLLAAPLAAALLAACGAPQAPPAQSGTPPAPTATQSVVTSQPAPTGASPTAVSPSARRTGAGSGTVKGVDVSRYQRAVDWEGLRASGHAFAWVKATEGTSRRSLTWASQSRGARRAGLLVGGYHYARPAASGGAAQARFFARNGGGWRADGATLPGALDLEAATSGDRCHGLTPRRFAAWVRDFSDEYRRLAGRRPVIYVKAGLWNRCTASDATFGDHPLWLYDHGGGMGPLPAGWARPTVWQHGVQNNLDRNLYQGGLDELRAWAGRP